MAPFLSRLFSIRNRRKQSPERNASSVHHSRFNGTHQIRVLLFRERFGQERRLLFDSKAVRKRDAHAANCSHPSRKIKENSFEKSFKLNDTSDKDIIYEWQRQSPDEQMLREMIFGSVSTSYHGTTMKVHTIRCPLQIMISIVYAAPSMAEFRLGEELEESGNSSSSAYEILVSRSSGTDQIHLGSLQSLDGYTSLPAYLSPEKESSNIPRSGSYNSLQRRLLRNKATSIQLGLQKLTGESQSEEFARIPRQNKIKLGLSIVISLSESKDEESQFQDFFFTHIALIEGHLLKLKNAVNEAYLNRKFFLHLMYEGSKKLQCSIHDLYTAPRLQFPEWLSIISSSNHHDMSHMFMEKLAHILKEYDKKETNFFVSTLLTAVLTHHLSWVSTVIPTDAKICSGQRSHKHVPSWVSMLAKSRPYNPLWVQLGDLYGAVSNPSKAAKIVVKGCKTEVILLFLQVLSYFVRCSDICEKVLEKERSQTQAEYSSPLLYKSFGWSLLAGVSDHYLEDFCLQGVCGSISEREIKQDLQNLTQIPILGEPLSEAVCILIDTNSWTVHVHSSNWSQGDTFVSSGLRVGMSSLVSNICEAVLNVRELGLPPESCIIYLEDRLQELYCHSLTLSEYVRCSQAPSSLDKVASALRMDASDMPLLLAIATTHSPHLAVFKS